MDGVTAGTRTPRWLVAGTIGAAAVVFAVLVAMATPPRVLLPSGPPPPPLPTAGPVTAQELRQVGLGELVDLATATRVPGVLADGSRLEAMSLDATGTLLGARRPTSDGRPEDVWRAGGAGGVPVRLQDTPPDPYLWTMASDGGVHVWPDREKLLCAPDGDPSRTRVLDWAWGGRTAFYAGGGVIAWTDAGLTRLRVADGCHGRIRAMPVTGVLDALAYPHVFVRNDTGLWQVNVRSGHTQLVLGGSPMTIGPDAVTTLAANAGIVAWGRADGIATLDRATGARAAASLDGSAGALTAGGRLLAFSSAQDNSIEYAVILDPATGRTAVAPGRAWAAGDWIAWRDGADYWLARARP